MSSARRRVKRPVFTAEKRVLAESSASPLPKKWLAGSVTVLLLALFAFTWKYVPAHSAPAVLSQSTPTSSASIPELASMPSPLHQSQHLQMMGEGGEWKRADQLKEGDKVWRNGRWLDVKGIKHESLTETKEVAVLVKPPTPKPREETSLELDLSRGGDTFEETIIVPSSTSALMINGLIKSAKELQHGDHLCMTGDNVALVQKVETKWYTPPPPSAPDKNGNVFSRVIGTTKRMTNRILYLHTDKETLDTTPEHPFSVEGKGWVQAGRLRKGDRIETEDGTTVTVESLEVKAERKMVYNLKVEGTETYFVGKNKMLVHNGGDCVPEILSRIKESPRLVREAEEAGRSLQPELDRLTAQLAQGNMNPGIGTRFLFNGISEARSANGARVYFRQVGNTIEILAKSTKANQDAVIAALQRLYGR